MRRRTIVCLTVVALASGSVCWAQQDDDVLIVDVDDRLTSGRPNFDGSWSLGTRSFLGEFDSEFAVNDPGWNTLGSGSPALPAGAEAPPADTDLTWDFLPMVIDGAASNLFFWDGNGAVAFGSLLGEAYELSLQSKASGFIGVDGAAALVAGAVIDDTDSVGSLHRHRFWFLDDGDDDQGTDPADGVYLLSIRTRMEGLDRSRPLFFLFGTPGTPGNALTAAQTWVEGVIDELAPDFAADFDGDLAVDSADLQTWLQGYGLNGSSALQITGDATFDDAIAGSDFLAWQQQAGQSVTTFVGAQSPSGLAAAVVPEPAAIVLIGAGIAVALSQRFR